MATPSNPSLPPVIGCAFKIPYSRAISIGLRTLHILAFSILVGGHAFNAPVAPLKPLLAVAIVSGAGMAFIEAFPSWRFLFEGWWLALVAKLSLLCLIPFFWNQRLPILLAVVVIASIASHMTGKLRHYSLTQGPAQAKPKPPLVV